MIDLVTLGGRRFRVLDFDRRTVAHDYAIMSLMRSTGLDRVMPMDGETNAVYLVRLHEALIDSGKACDLVGAYLLPEGFDELDWTPKAAKETAQFIARCNTEDDRLAVNKMAMDVVMGFFKLGLERLKTFLASSAANPSEEKTENHAVH